MNKKKTKEQLETSFVWICDVFFILEKMEDEDEHMFCW
jgi:hypothetical protein